MTVRKPAMKPGDLVTVNDGLPYLARILSIEGARLTVRPIIGERKLAPKHAKRAWIDQHWRLVYNLRDRALFDD